ncbi:hypothetical protein HRG09_09575 [Bacillus sp. Xin1]|uniref:hypothetical protein n=1 Tax=Bacillus sp. Xin1 TaxID=2740676 RepID=UPI001571F273|nr:hypothetical protein [Bacillus sp. Xin1]NSW36320.1 hypothetical protein [Bacillus sp. Xin1]
MKTFTTPQEILKKFTYKISKTKEIIPSVIKLLSIFYKQEKSILIVKVRNDIFRRGILSYKKRILSICVAASLLVPASFYGERNVQAENSNTVQQLYKVKMAG